MDFKGPHPWFKNRKLRGEPVELTSRESTENIKRSKDRLNKSYGDDGHVDVLLASNMISVGVDIDRLGLMVVAGQPKTTAEYIQASSRVGRQESRPGLVATCMNIHKPRDRSHYERFTRFHQSFYRGVEATSVTPFSGPALDRGLAGTLMAMARFIHEEMTPAAGVMYVARHKAELEDALEALAERAERQPRQGRSQEDELIEQVKRRGRNLLETWESNEEIADAVQTIHGGEDAPRERLRTAEYKEFLTANDEMPGEIPPREQDFFASRLVPTRRLPAPLADITLVKKLRKVTAQVGFTRLEAPSADLQGSYAEQAQLAALTLSQDWLPATEIFGEGVLLRFDEQAVAEWESRPAVVERAHGLLRGYVQKFGKEASPKGASSPAPCGARAVDFAISPVL